VRDNGGVTETGRPVRLTSDEVALVLRRAAEIEAAEDATVPALAYDPAAVEEAAREVGLSPAAVRQAVAELRVGVLPGAPVDAARQRSRRRALASRRVTDQRLIDRPPAVALATIDRFMRTQMFELRRRSGDRSLYRHRADLIAGLRRRLDFAGVIKLERLTMVDVVVTEADERTLVRIEAELATSHPNAVAAGAAAGTAVTVLTGVGGAVAGEAGLVIAAVPMGALVGAGSMRVAGARWQQRRDDVAEVLAHLLDGL
jgi:uncharacterized protein YfiM (DUF2279 family)